MNPTELFPPLAASYLKILSNNNYLAELIAKVTGQSPEDALARLIREHEEPGLSSRREMEALGVELYAWSEKLVEFYQKTDAFIYECVVWNRMWEKIKMQQWIVDFLTRDFDHPVRILAYGDGLGFDSLFFSLAGHDVSYFEVSEKCLSFARHIFDRAGVHVQMIDDIDTVENEAYDVVVCLDVLEHVPDPPAEVERMVAALRPGGKLIVSAPFFHIAPNTSTHLRRNQQYSGNVSRLYAPYGLRLYDGRFFWNPVVLNKECQESKMADKSANTNKAVVWVSGFLLVLGRYWAAPHVWMAKALCGPDRRRLKEMVSRD